jgi:carbamoyl-phosphate synthase large subunit
MGDTVRIVGLAYDALDSSLYAPMLLDEAFMVPYPSAGPATYLQRILQIHRQVPLDAFIPCLDVELPVLDEISPQLSKAAIGMFLPNREQLARRSKEQLGELAQLVDVASPETHRVVDAASLESMGKKLGYPYVLKGPYCDAEVANGPNEAAAAYRRLAARWGLPLLAQRFVEGEEFDVVCLGDGLGGMPGAVAMRKTIITRLGKAWGAVTLDDPELLDAARRVVATLRWRGGCEIELLRDKRGTLNLLEVNPRLPAWVYLATAAGVNLPQGLLELALDGQVAPFAKAQAGIFCVRHAVETTGALEDIDALVTLGARSHIVRPATTPTQVRRFP